VADVVVIADGANSLLAQKAGLARDARPEEQALVAKELLRLPAEEIDRRFAVPPGQGVAIEAFGAATGGLLGYGFIYTNRETLSIGTGALLNASSSIRRLHRFWRGLSSSSTVRT